MLYANFKVNLTLYNHFSIILLIKKTPLRVVLGVMNRFFKIGII